MEIDPRMLINFATVIFAAGIAWGISKRSMDQNEKAHDDMWQQIDKARVAVAKHASDSQERRIEYERRIAEIAMAAQRTEDRYMEVKVQLEKIGEKLDRIIEGRRFGDEK